MSKSQPEVLIVSWPHDIHTQAVLWGLRKAGVSATPWYFSDVPSKQRYSVNVSGPTRSLASTHASLGSLNLSALKCVWLRRTANAVLPLDLDPADHRPVKSQFQAQSRSALGAMERPGVRWVNTPQSREAAQDKLRQLSEAADCGLSIPPTLFSNDPDDVRSFFHEHEGRVVIKPHNPSHWDEDGFVATLYTTPLREIDLADDRAIQYCPAIYQPYVSKAYEVRSTIFGGVEFSMQILSQQGTKHAAHDWRGGHSQGRPHVLPPETLAQCQELFARLGIVFGCVDFIVEPSGRYVFLEVNQMGQFLWVEEQCAELPLLSAFTEFLATGQTNRQPSQRWRDITISKFLEQYDSDSYLSEVELNHVPAEPDWVRPLKKAAVA